LCKPETGCRSGKHLSARQLREQPVFCRIGARDQDGRVRRVLATIVSGFICRGRFYTRKAAARAMSVGNPG
jgi:hypothetical protein